MNNCKFVILNEYRCGSTLLCEALNSHPDLIVEKEILHGWNNWRKPIIDKFYKGKFSLNADLSVLMEESFKLLNGFKIIYSQIPRNCSVWDYLKSLDDLKIIFLNRKNLLHAAISFKASENTGIWHKGINESKRPVKKFKFNSKELLKMLIKIEDNENYFKKFFNNKQHINISYESLIENWEDNIRNIQSFLEVDLFPVKPSLQKLINDHKSLITNYDELCNYFKYTKWAEFFKPVKSFL